jgi:hypothetical protein
VAQYSQKVYIQNALVAAGRAGKFFKVAYDKETGLQEDIDFETSTDTVAPSSALANETLSTFGLDPSYKIDRVDKRLSWTFELWLDFNQEVNAEHFEETLIRNPIVLPSSKSKGVRQVTLRLTRDTVQHPVTQQPSSGTKLRLAFNAEVGRI